MRVIVLNDGETFTDAEGCLFLEIDLGGIEKAEIDDYELKAVCTLFQLEPARTNAPMQVDYKGEDIMVDVSLVARFL